MSELCGLNSTSFDRERELLEVEGSSKKRRTDLGSKGKRGRRVPMSLIARRSLNFGSPKEAVNSMTPAPPVEETKRRYFSTDVAIAWGAVT